MTTTTLVLGLGSTGAVVARTALAAGERVVVVEDQPGTNAAYAARAAELRAAGGTLHEAPPPHAVGALAAAADLVVPSPGVPERHPAVAAAVAAGVAVRAEIDLAAQRCPVPFVAITGTNAKTTVTTLVTDMLVRSGRRAVAAGNVGRPFLDALDDPVDVVVAEVSSFQLRFTGPAFRPRVAVLLNLGEDHLDWHGGVEAYAAAKARVFAHQERDDVLVHDADDPRVRALVRDARSRRVAFGAGPNVAHVEDDELLDGTGALLAPARVVRPLGALDRLNALAAALAAREIGATGTGIAAALATYPRLPHRAALVGEHGGVRWVDDSKATNPHATARAVVAFAPVVLIAGGRNKGLDLGVLRALAPKVHAVVAIGDAAGEVERAFAGAAEVVRARSMDEAVVEASARARPGDTVLLSPACASFDWYESYGERGDDFRRAVAQLVGVAS